MMKNGKRGRKALPARIKVNAVKIEGGKSKHFFSVISYRSPTEIMRILQLLRDGANEDDLFSFDVIQGKFFQSNSGKNGSI